MRYISAIIAASTVACVLAAEPAASQELVFGFKNPSFGGNPFYSDHLMATATAQRPERRSEDGATELTEGEQFARQIQSRLLSALSSSLVEAITGSAPGTTGEFVVGDQTIFFERSLTTIRLVITNNATGETTEIIVPVLNFSVPGAQSAAGDGSPKGGGPSASGLAEGGLVVAGSGDLVVRGSALGQSPLAATSLDQGSLEPLNLGSGL